MAEGGLIFVVEDLFSKAARSKIGTRVVDGFELATSNNTGGIAGIISFILSGLGSLVGFLVNVIGGLISFSWTEF